jgi:hypothetical protein
LLIDEIKRLYQAWQGPECSVLVATLLDTDVHCKTKQTERRWFDPFFMQPVDQAGTGLKTDAKTSGLKPLSWKPA